MKTVTRFAPSPSGDMHPAMPSPPLKPAVWPMKTTVRCGCGSRISMKAAVMRYIVTIKDDLEFLGIAWEGEVTVQSERMAHISRR